jgi:peroxiredoxin
MRIIATLALLIALVSAQPKAVIWSSDEAPLLEQLRGLRKLPDDERARTTKQLAIQIRQLPSTANKVRLAANLAGLATEGDFGHDTLQEVASTLAESLREQPEAGEGPYYELAQLVRYEHVRASSADPKFAAAMSRLEADDQARANADFTLRDLHGKSWTLHDLHGKVVLVNFWATWCPPCRKEMPDLDALFHQFKKQGLVVLAISDEEEAKVKPFVAARQFKFPILLDPGRKVNSMFRIEGIPKSFVYDREGKLVAQSIDMRTRKQFLEMLAAAGLK